MLRFNKTIRTTMACATVLAAATSCQSPKPSDTSTGNYRTVSANPARDTESAQRHNTQGLALLKAGALNEAAQAFERALEADVEFGPAHNNLGKVYYHRRDWYRAAWEFEYAAKLLERRPEPVNNLGLVLEEAGELDRAIEQYRRAADLDRADVQYQANLARALVRRGDTGNEVDALLTAVAQRDPRTSWKVWATHEQAQRTRQPIP